MLAIQVGRVRDAEEELRAVGAGAGVGHGEDAGALMGQCGINFIGELVAGAARACA